MVYRCPSVLAVNAVVRRNDGILLVQQQGPDDPEPSWFLPGGIVEAGETIDQGLCRELREETGLSATTIGPLLWMTHIVDPASEHQTLAFAFQVDELSGELQPDDPDEYILDARFLPIEEAAKMEDAGNRTDAGHAPAADRLSSRHCPVRNVLDLSPPARRRSGVHRALSVNGPQPASHCSAPFSQSWERGNTPMPVTTCSPVGCAAPSIGRRLRTGWG